VSTKFGILNDGDDITFSFVREHQTWKAYGGLAVFLTSELEVSVELCTLTFI
jgi:hypothetical protein